MKTKLLSLGTLAIVGTSAFVVVACGKEEEKKEVTVDLAKEKMKMSAEFDTMDQADATGANFTTGAAVGADVTAKFKQITEIKATSPQYGAFRPFTAALAKGVEIKSAVVKTLYDAATKKLVLTVTIAHGGKETSKQVTITFGTTDASTEIAKFSNALMIAKSADSAVSAKNFAKLLADDTDKKVDFIALEEMGAGSAIPTGTGKILSTPLSTGFSIAKIMVKEKYNIKTAKMVITVALAKGTDVLNRATAMKDITLTFGGEDLVDEVAKLKTKIADIPHGKMSEFSSFNTANADAKTPYEALQDLIFKDATQKFSTGVSINAVVVMKAFANADRSITLTVKLNKARPTNGIKYGTNMVDVVLTFAAAPAS